MIVEPFSVGAFSFFDVQDLTFEQNKIVAEALIDGLRMVALEDRCEARGLSSQGDYPLIRFGAFHTGVLVGGLCLGSNYQTEASTEDSVVVTSVPLPGCVPGGEVLFTVRSGCTLIEWLLVSKLLRRDGGTVGFESFSYSFDKTRPHLSPMAAAVLPLLLTSEEVSVAVSPDRDRNVYVVSAKAPL